MDIFVWTCIFVGSHCVLGSRWPTGALSVGPTMSPYPHHCPLCHPTLTIVTLHSPIGPLLGDAHSLHHMGKPASKYTEHKLLKSCDPPKKLCIQLYVSVSKTIQWIRASQAVWVKGDLLAGGRDATHSHTCRSYHLHHLLFLPLLSSSSHYCQFPSFFADVSSELLPIHVSFQADWRRNTLTVHMHRPLFSSLLFCCCCCCWKWTPTSIFSSTCF